MARYYFISALCGSLLLASCAQVGLLSGGDDDVHAPRPVDDKTSPANGSVRFEGNRVSITFDEYFTLKKPAENILMVPPHALIQTSIKKKTLTLFWDDTLSPNTTYSIYLNNVVADLTEGNDSTMQFVFSTGDEIDSLSYSTIVVDAKSNAPRKNVSLLFYDQLSGELISIAKTDDRGRGSLRYLKPGNYTILALNDENHNRQIDDKEEVGFSETEFISLTQSVSDSTGIRLFLPEELPGIRSVQLIEPASFIISCTEIVKNADITINDESIPTDQIRYLAEDSLLVFVNDSLGSSANVIVKSDLFTDTLKLKYGGKRDRSIRVKSLSETDLAPSDTICLELNDRIKTIDPHEISLMNSDDSTFIESTEIKYELNRIWIVFDKEELNRVVLNISAGAISCFNGSNPDFTANFTLLPSRKFGVLKLDLSAYNDPLVVEILRDRRLDRSVSLSDPASILTLNELIPGDYTFRVIRDENQNGRWDSGNLETRKQAEKIDHYSQSTKVRANWELVLPLSPLDEE